MTNDEWSTLRDRLVFELLLREEVKRVVYVDPPMMFKGRHIHGAYNPMTGLVKVERGLTVEREAFVLAHELMHVSEWLDGTDDHDAYDQCEDKTNKILAEVAGETGL